MVVAARDWRAGTAARQAMGELAQLYWFPLYAYLRRRGSPPAQAEDLVQGFFAQLLERDALTAVDRSKGKFRSFLLACLQNYLADQSDKARALKRGGHRPILSLDALAAEARYAAEPVDQLTPERVFERRWARTLIDETLARLRDDYAARGQAPLFAALQHLLVGDAGDTYARLAPRLGLTEAAVKVAAHRLRRRYRELLRDQIAQTVSDPALIAEEIRQLLSSL
jgi:RNA polymerase sigma-70 factor (ECF subfamily)